MKKLFCALLVILGLSSVIPQLELSSQVSAAPGQPVTVAALAAKKAVVKKPRAIRPARHPHPRVRHKVRRLRHRIRTLRRRLHKAKQQP